MQARLEWKLGHSLFGSSGIKVRQRDAVGFAHAELDYARRRG